MSKLDDFKSFVASKPDVLIIDNDNSTISKNIIDYFDKKSKLIKLLMMKTK